MHDAASRDFPRRVATRIVTEVGINRVTYDITSKPPGTIEWSELQAILIGTQ